MDLDGCVYLGGEPIDGAPEAIAALREAGKRIAFVTNDPRQLHRGLRPAAVGHRRAGLAG